MSDGADEVLPYRSDPADLARWIDGRARAQSAAQLREQGFSPKTLEGTVATATALGLLESDGKLTARGERYALAGESERRALLGEALLSYAPYRRLLEDLAGRPERAVTDAQWIETWWATHGYGNSRSNRMEATAVLGRLVEYVGWGRYIPGRRGHPTRIEWVEHALPRVAPRREPPRGTDPPFQEAAAPSAPRVEPPSPPVRPGATVEMNRVAVALGPGQVARLEIPLQLSAAEKRRLLQLLDLMIAENG